MEDVGFKANTSLGGANSFERRRIEVGPVGEDFEIARAVGFGVGHRFKQVDEVRGVVGGHPLGAMNAVLRRTPDQATEKIARQHQGGNEAEHKPAGGDDDGEVTDHECDLQLSI